MKPKDAQAHCQHLPPAAAPGAAGVAPRCGAPRQRATWAHAGCTLATCLLWACLQAAQATPARAEAEVTSAGDWQAWRDAMLQLTHQEAGDALGQIRHRYELARERGDRHFEWMHLAWLAKETARLDHARSAPLLTLAEQALQAAQRAGDKVAAFELLTATESARLEQQIDTTREARLTQAAALASELGQPQRHGLVTRLRGLAAAQEGQPGEAQVQYERARLLLPHTIDQADLLLLMARSELDKPTRAGADQAQAYLGELALLWPQQRSPFFVDALLLRAAVLRQLDRGPEAVTSALQAVSVARQLGLSTHVARAQVALGQTYLAAGSPSQALANFQSTPLDALDVADRLNCLAGRALALAQRQDPSAVQWLDAAHDLLQHARHTPGVALLRFHETAAQARQLLGDAEGAVREMVQARALRATMANTAREKLVQARIDAARGVASATSDAQLERVLLVAAGSLVLALLVLGALSAWHGRQRRLATRASCTLEAENTRLQQINAARNRHLAAACHDLRQPAHVIGQVADTLLLDPSHDRAAAQQHFDTVSRCSHTLDDMLDALLDLSVLEQGRYEPRLEPVRLGELMAEVDTQYRRAAQDKGLTWQVGTSHALVLADRHLLRRVLFHLAANAVRYSSHGGIQVLAVTADDRVWVEVADTGPGLPADQLHGAPPAAGPGASPAGALGLGTGLAIVREGCRLMAHEVTVPVSSPRGSVVRVTMPRLATADHATEDHAWCFSGQTVAVVEPDMASRQTTVEALCAAGLRAASFASLTALREASAAYPATGPDALVVDLGGDLMTQGIGELQAWRRVCPAWPGPVLALTADLRIDGLMRAAELGVNLACKPLTAAKLLELLGDLLRRRELESQRPAGTDGEPPVWPVAQQPVRQA